jgi:hypothetical protein
VVLFFHTLFIFLSSCSSSNIDHPSLALVLRHGGTIDDNDESDDEGADLHDLVIGLCCVTFV